MIFEWIYLIFRLFLRSLFWRPSLETVEVENALLLKEIQLLRRKVKRPKLLTLDRFFYIFLYQNYKNALNKATLIKPATVLAWHKKLVARKWDYSKKKVGRPPISDAVKKLVVEMKQANKRWGCQRIKGELHKLGIHICKRSVSNILKSYGFDPSKRKTSYSWFEFLHSQGSRFWAMDFFTVETLTLQRLFVFFIIDVQSREVVLWNVVDGPPNEHWLRNYLNSELAFQDDLPDVLISDRDHVYGKWLQPFLADRGIKLVKTPPNTPVCNAFAERYVRTVRQDCLDWMLIYNEEDLKRVLKQWTSYYNERRSHSSLDFNAPCLQFNFKNEFFHLGQVKKTRYLNGLITDFALAS